MSGAVPLKVDFSADDRLSPTIRSIGASLRAMVVTSGLSRFAAIGGQLAGTMSGLAQAGILATASLAGVGGAASAAGLANLAVGAAASAAQLQALGETARVPIERMEVLADIARRANVSQDDLASGLGTLNERMQATARGGNRELRWVMTRLGISLRDTNGQVRNAADVLPNFANAFQRIRDPALRAELATALFGETGARILPILSGGAAGLREGERNFNRYGVSIAGMVAVLAPISKQFDGLRNSLTGFALSISTAIGSELAPVLGPIAEDLDKWIQANRAVIATDIAKYIRETAVGQHAQLVLVAPAPSPLHARDDLHTASVLNVALKSNAKIRSRQHSQKAALAGGVRLGGVFRQTWCSWKASPPSAPRCHGAGPDRGRPDC